MMAGGWIRVQNLLNYQASKAAAAACFFHTYSHVRKVKRRIWLCGETCRAFELVVDSSYGCIIILLRM